VTAGLFIEIKEIMIEKKPVVHNSPDLSKMKEVVIDHRTRIYIALSADATEAKSRYLANLKNRKP
jgi:hypothetical protein